MMKANQRIRYLIEMYRLLISGQMMKIHLMHTISIICKYLKLTLLSTTNLSSVASNKLSTQQNILKADSGATKHFLKQVHAYLLRNLVPLQHGPQALLPNKTVITPSHSGNLPFSNG